MANTIRIIYPPHHRKSAKQRQARKDRLEALGLGLIMLGLIYSITYFSLHAI
jgi:hypothetical protein